MAITWTFSFCYTGWPTLFESLWTLTNVNKFYGNSEGNYDGEAKIIKSKLLSETELKILIMIGFQTLDAKYEQTSKTHFLKNWLVEYFLRKAIEWSARSPDLTPMNFKVILMIQFSKIGHKCLMICKGKSPIC